MGLRVAGREAASRVGQAGWPQRGEVCGVLRAGRASC